MSQGQRVVDPIYLDPWGKVEGAGWCRRSSKPLPIPYGITADGRQFRTICLSRIPSALRLVPSAVRRKGRATPYA